MWPFTKKAEAAAEPIPLTSLEEFRLVETELARLDREYRNLRYRNFSTTSSGASVLCTTGPHESVQVGQELRRLLSARDRLVPRRNELLAAMAREKMR